MEENVGPGVELRIDVHSTDGRLSGTVRRPPSPTAHPFSGRLELLAWLERLATAPETPGRGEQP